MYTISINVHVCEVESFYISRTTQNFEIEILYHFLIQYIYGALELSSRGNICLKNCSIYTYKITVVYI